MSRHRRVRAVVISSLSLLAPFLTLSLPGSVVAQDRPGSDAPPEARENAPPESASEDSVRGSEAAPSGDAAELAALRARLAELEARLELMEALEEAPPPEAPPPRLPELPTALNPRITAFLNGVGRADTREVIASEAHGHGGEAGEEAVRVDDRFILRETEVDLRAAVDPFVEGVLTIALEEELPGEFHVGVEEGYALVKSLPLPGLETMPLGLVTRVGRFRASLGRNNQLHTHDLPQTTRPLAVRAFLGPEGTLGDGVSARAFLPLLWFDEPSTVQLTLEAFNGAFPASEHDAGQFVANLAFSRPLGAHHQVALSAIGHLGRPTLEADWLGSLEALYQWRPATWRGAVVGAQGFWLWPAAAAAGEAPVQGAYAFAQWQFSRELFAGLRYDRTAFPEHPDETVEGLFPYVSWYASEFFRLRLGWEQQWHPAPEEDLGTLWLEVNFLFGSHPPHPYWVHR